MKKVILFAMLGLLMIAPVFAQPFDIRTIATVNLHGGTQAIYGRDLRTRVERLEREAGRALSMDERRQVLDSMINEELIFQAATRDNITVTDTMVNNHINDTVRPSLAAQLGVQQVSNNDFIRAVREQFGLEVNITTSPTGAVQYTGSYRDGLRREIIIQRYLESKVGMPSNVEPTAEEINRDFRLRRTIFVRPETVEFDLIQIPYGSNDAAARTRARELGERLVRDINSNPSRFDTIGDQHVRPDSGYRYMREYALPMIPEALASFGDEFFYAAFGLRQGQVSRLLETPDGFVIIKITRNLDLKILELDDNVPSHLLPPLLASIGIDPRSIRQASGITVRSLLSTAISAQKAQAAYAESTQKIINELRTGRTVEIREANLTW